LAYVSFCLHQAMLHAGKLLIAADLALAEAFAQELREFRMTMTEAGNSTFNASSGQHDDLVLAVAIAIWHIRTSRPTMSWVSGFERKDFPPSGSRRTK
jgi:hypothetical protein